MDPAGARRRQDLSVEHIVPPLSIVMPVYNEADNILAVLRDLGTVQTQHEVLLVYDFEEDTTLPVFRSSDHVRDNVRLVRNHMGTGVLSAMRTGIDAAAAPLVLIMMADGADDVRDIDRMVERADLGADLVSASRYAKGGRQIGGPRLKRLLSRSAGLSLYWFGRLPIHDPTNNFKLYRRAFLDSVLIESTAGFELGLELSVKAALGGFVLDEVPTTWRDRTAGTSRFRLRRWLPHYVRWYSYYVRRRVRSALRALSHARTDGRS
jgi:dolichol-phosphate mannosyltransferase